MIHQMSPIQSDLPAGVHSVPQPADYKKPVKWLLGEQIIADLKLLVLYSMFGNKLDSRDWMTPEIIHFLVPEKKEAPPQITPDAAAAVSARAGADGEELKKERALLEAIKTIELAPGAAAHGISAEEFWFDFLADTGDGQKATYSVAYICMSHLVLEKKADGTHELSYVKSEDLDLPTGTDTTLLPRGRFLFIGGDTSYNIAEYSNLVERFQSPFCWAYSRLKKEGSFSQAEIEQPRPLFGIPGNHDYYDALDGFNRQFRQPVTEKFGKSDGESRPEMLQIPAFRRYQQASYVALHLPFDWWLWGLDTESNELDFRQQEFFNALRDEFNPQKLIIATPAPTTHFGRRAKPTDKLTEVFTGIGLEVPFISEEDIEKSSPEEQQKFRERSTLTLAQGKCRLDLSGDIHHYARYWGQTFDETREIAAKDAKEEVSVDIAAVGQNSPTNYASVMTGGGGAFFHPSDTDIKEIEERVLYPSRIVSRSAVLKKLFNPFSIANAGYVWVLGIIMSCLMFFAATIPQSSSDAMHTFPPWYWLGVTEKGFVRPTVPLTEEQTKSKDAVTPFALMQLVRIAPDKWIPSAHLAEGAVCHDKEGKELPMYFFGSCRLKRPWDYIIGVLSIHLSWILILAATYFSFGALSPDPSLKWRKRMRMPGGEQQGGERPETNGMGRRVALAITGVGILTAFLIGFGIMSIKPYLAFNTPFGNSLYLLIAICISICAIILAVKFGEWQFRQLSRKRIRRHRVYPQIIMWALAVGVLGVCLWVFGRNNLAAYLFWDILVTTLGLAVLIGLIALAFAKGRELHHRTTELIGFGLIGLWHALLQLSVPFFLVKRGNMLVLIYAGAVILIFTWFGLRQAKIRGPKNSLHLFGLRRPGPNQRLGRLNNRATLLIVWFLFGLLLLLWPLVGKLMPHLPDGLSSFIRGLPGYNYPARLPVVHFLAQYFTSLEAWVDVLDGLLIAGIIGAVTSCLWFGWYLAIMLAFNAHNNEAGGAARLEGFKQFVRIKLTKNELTAYVVGFDEAVTDGNRPHLKLIDHFTIRQQAL